MSLRGVFASMFSGCFVGAKQKGQPETPQPHLPRPATAVDPIKDQASHGGDATASAQQHSSASGTDPVAGSCSVKCHCKCSLQQPVAAADAPEDHTQAVRLWQLLQEGPAIHGVSSMTASMKGPLVPSAAGSGRPLDMSALVQHADSLGEPCAVVLFTPASRQQLRPQRMNADLLVDIDLRALYGNTARSAAASASQWAGVPTAAAAVAGGSGDAGTGGSGGAGATPAEALARQLAGVYQGHELLRLSPAHINPALKAVLPLSSPHEYQALLAELLGGDQRLKVALHDMALCMLEGADAAPTTVLVRHLLAAPAGAREGGRPSKNWRPSHVVVPLAVHPIAVRRPVMPANPGSSLLGSEVVAGVVLRYSLGEGLSSLLQQLHCSHALLASLPGPVTLFTLGGGRVLHQNTASVAYMGLRQGLGAGHPGGGDDNSNGKRGGSSERGQGPGPAGAHRHAAGGADAGAGAAPDGNALRQLFVFSPDKLDSMLADVAEGKTWRGIVRVPVMLSTCAAPCVLGDWMGDLLKAAGLSQQPASSCQGGVSSPQQQQFTKVCWNEAQKELLDDDGRMKQAAPRLAATSPRALPPSGPTAAGDATVPAAARPAVPPASPGMLARALGAEQGPISADARNSLQVQQGAIAVSTSMHNMRLTSSGILLPPALARASASASADIGCRQDSGGLDFMPGSLLKSLLDASSREGSPRATASGQMNSRSLTRQASEGRFAPAAAAAAAARLRANSMTAAGGAGSGGGAALAAQIRYQNPTYATSQAGALQAQDLPAVDEDRSATLSPLAIMPTYSCSPLGPDARKSPAAASLARPPPSMAPRFASAGMPFEHYSLLSAQALQQQQQHGTPSSPPLHGPGPSPSQALRLTLAARRSIKRRQSALKGLGLPQDSGANPLSTSTWGIGLDGSGSNARHDAVGRAVSYDPARPLPLGSVPLASFQRASEHLSEDAHQRTWLERAPGAATEQPCGNPRSPLPLHAQGSRASPHLSGPNALVNVSGPNALMHVSGPNALNASGSFALPTAPAAQAAAAPSLCASSGPQQASRSQLSSRMVSFVLAAAGTGSNVSSRASSRVHQPLASMTHAPGALVAQGGVRDGAPAPQQQQQRKALPPLSATSLSRTSQPNHDGRHMESPRAHASAHLHPHVGVQALGAAQRRASAAGQYQQYAAASGPIPRLSGALLPGPPGSWRKREDDAAAADGEDHCWHEVTAKCVPWPATGEQVLLLLQADVTARVVAEQGIVAVLEAEHKLLESCFPRHVLELAAKQQEPPLTAEGGPVTAMAAAGLGHFSLARLPGANDCTSTATHHPMVTVLFADIVGFTSMCHEVPAAHVMHFLNQLYTRLDSLLDVYGVYKVETIGDCYMVCGGLTRRDADGFVAVRRGGEVDELHAEKVMAFAKAMLRESVQVLLPTTSAPVQVRIGLHSGPVVSGIVGSKMPRFCLFGDTVNTASRMESTCPPGRIHASASTRALLPGEEWQATGGIEIKGKGLMETFQWAGCSHAVQEMDGSFRRSSARLVPLDASGSGSPLPSAQLQLYARDRRARRASAITFLQAQAMGLIVVDPASLQTRNAAGEGDGSSPCTSSASTTMMTPPCIVAGGNWPAPAAAGAGPGPAPAAALRRTTAQQLQPQQQQLAGVAAGALPAEGRRQLMQEGRRRVVRCSSATALAYFGARQLELEPLYML